MKIRAGFVSNSSSSSFVLQKKDITAEQLEKIKNHIRVSRGDKLGEKFDGFHFDNSDSDAWTIWETETEVHGETIMNNFDMELFLTEIGVNPNLAVWEEI